MIELFNWLFTFIGKMLAIPELHAILAAVSLGFAIAYLLTLPLPAWATVKFVRQYARVIIFFTVLGIAVNLIPTPRMAIWAITVAIFTPLFYEWLITIIFHKWPWLKPKSLMSPDELEKYKDK